jgi:Ca2+-binding RTX toxin-like protein
MATWWGNDNDNNHHGPQKNQYGLGGDDTLVTTDKGRSYVLYGGNGDDQLVGYNKGDQLYGGSHADNLYGYGGNDYLDGGAGRDFLGGFKGNDILSGGRGNDVFFFETKLNAKKNFDKILDFAPGQDEMRLDNDIFHGTGKTGHSLKSKKFEVGKEATDSDTRILYHENKGVAYYTPHGDNGKQTKFVKVSKGLDLDHDDFFIIA